MFSGAEPEQLPFPRRVVNTPPLRVQLLDSVTLPLLPSVFDQLYVLVYVPSELNVKVPFELPLEPSLNLAEPDEFHVPTIQLVVDVPELVSPPEDESPLEPESPSLVSTSVKIAAEERSGEM